MSEEGLGKVVAMEMALIYINIRDFWFLSKGEATCVVRLLTKKKKKTKKPNKPKKPIWEKPKKQEGSMVSRI